MEMLFLIFLFLINILTSVNSYWHIYDENKEVEGNCKTVSKNFTEITQRNPHFKLWPGLLSSLDNKFGDTIFGLEEAMDAIWKNQNPPDCSKAKFLIAEGWIQGFGSDVHVTGIGLGVALNLGRVFMMNPDGALKNHVRDNTWYTNNSYCREQGKQSMECYYEPWTHCSFEDALGSKNWLDFKVHHKTYFSDTDFAQKNQEFLLSFEKTILYESRADSPHIFPESLLPLLACSNISPNKHIEWWRAISSTFLLRPNTHTLAQFAKYRQLEFPRHFHPEQRQCVSIYVRRGDKHVEMNFVSLYNYLQTAKALWDLGLVAGPGGSPSPIHNPSQSEYNRFPLLPQDPSQIPANYLLPPPSFPSSSSSSSSSSSTHSNLRSSSSSSSGSAHHSMGSSPHTQGGGGGGEGGVIFLGSEDMRVIREAVQWTQTESGHGWEVLYSNLFDRDQVTTNLDWDAQQKMFANKGERHHDLEYFSMLYNLDLHLHCSAYVCTLASNWCRLIDELRATVGGKANRHFADVGVGSILRPKIDVVTDFYWRK